MIIDLKAREVLDSRGNPTVEVEMRSKNHIAMAIVPSGASTGSHEAYELRDHDPKRFCGKGVLKAVSHVTREIKKAVLRMPLSEQRALDERLITLDGTPNKSKLGANAILGVSIAYARLSALEAGIPLFQYFANISGTKLPLRMPRPMMNVINGGRHADNTLDIQEFMLYPKATKFSENLRIGAETFHTLKHLLQERNKSTSVGDEGGFAPDLQTHEEAISLMVEASKRAGHEKTMEFALDSAASEFFDRTRGVYVIEGEATTPDQLIEYYSYLCNKFPIVSIEDPFAEDDWDHWIKLTKKMGKKIQIVGDDLLVTDVKRLQKAIDLGACNAILIKLNQVGTVTETINAITLGKKHGFKVIISHRSGETEDTTIADLAVGTNAGHIKTGSLSRSERVAKYNQLLRIEEVL